MDTAIKNRVFIGLGAIILPGAVIGGDCVVGGYLGVRGSIRAGY